MSTEEKLNKFVGKMLESAEAVVDFGKEQLPQYLEEVVEMEYMTNLGWGFSLAALAAIAFLVSSLVLFFCIKGGKGEGIVAGCAGMVIFAIIFCSSADCFWDAYKAKNFPKVTVVEYLIELKSVE